MVRITQTNHASQDILGMFRDAGKFQSIHPTIEVSLRMELMRSGRRKQGSAALHTAMVHFLAMMTRYDDEFEHSYQQWYIKFNYHQPKTVRRALDDLEAINLFIRTPGKWRGVKSIWKLNINILEKIICQI